MSPARYLIFISIAVFFYVVITWWFRKRFINTLTKNKTLRDFFTLNLLLLYLFIYVLRRVNREIRFGSIEEILIFFYIIMLFVLFIFTMTFLRDLFYGLYKMVLVIYSARGFSTPSPEFNRKILKYSSVAILIAAGAGVFFGIHQATDTLKINEVTIVDSNLPEKFSGFKIVLLSDLHVGPTLKTDFVKKIVAKTNEAEPDIIVIAGDLVDGPWHKVAGMLKPMKNFNAPVYFSPGNHELYWKFNTWKKNLQKTGIHILSESYTIIKKNSEKLLLGGIPDVFRWSGGENFNYRGPERIIKKAPPSDYRILIAHRPSIAKNAFKAGFNLMLSGHTHGGQTFPITLLGLINRNLGHGLFRHEGLHYYVSSGAGFWGPPVRLFNSPEIVVITLKTH